MTTINHTVNKKLLHSNLILKEAQENYVLKIIVSSNSNKNIYEFSVELIFLNEISKSYFISWIVNFYTTIIVGIRILNNKKFLAFFCQFLLVVKISSLHSLDCRLFYCNLNIEQGLEVELVIVPLYSSTCYLIMLDWWPFV